MSAEASAASALYREALRDFRHDRLEEAREKLARVLALDPNYEDAYEALSVILYNQKQYDEAIALIKKWFVVNPNSIMSHTNMSRCYVAKGLILEAEHEQAEARRLTWKAELKAKKMDMPKVDYTEQIARFKKVIALDPADVLGYFSLGTAYLDSGKKREAVETFEKAVTVDPKHSSSYLGLGLAYEGLGDIEKAKKIYLEGSKVADERGDVMTLKKMESRVRVLEGNV
jgi:tetratricopeptide (TPR) repeat protein